MNILYIHQYFKTPSQGGATRSYHIAKAMLAAGHQVEMITSYNEKQYLTEDIEGIKVHYLPIPYDNSFSIVKRIWAFFSFFCSATILAIKLKKDIIYATSTPISVGGIALLNKWIKKTPYIFEVRDLWPQVPIEMGYIRNPLFISILNKFEKLIYKNSQNIIALSPGIELSIINKCQGKPVMMIPNFADIEYFNHHLKPISNKITISYIGTFGKANGLEAYIELAKIAQDNFLDKFHFNLMGEGAETEKLKKMSTSYQLNNISFIPFSNKENVKSLMRDSDLIYVSFANFPILGQTTSPNKLFDALAMHKPIIVNFNGWLSDLILKNYAGFIHQTSNSKTLLSEILETSIDQNKWVSMSDASGKLATEYFNKELLIDKLVKECFR
jgi:glycosyltransferase involved in cell wall biosynthesis